MRKSILIIDDEEMLLKALERFLTEQGYSVVVVSDGERGLEMLRSKDFDLLLIDLMLPRVSGVEILREAHTLHPNMICIVMTGYGTIPSAVEAMKAGAHHYVTKPFDLVDVGTLIAKSLEMSKMRDENRVLRKLLQEKFGPKNIIGQSVEIKKVLKFVEQVADTDSTILIMGESGTGKEVLARTIHYRSHRSERPFVPVNCAAIPENLLESELFGHVKGAFTDAATTRMGRFETADGGTLFLDEIGDMSPKLQVKLLRVLQQKRFEPLGSSTPKQVDIRVVAATNQDLAKAVAEGRFREDLYYRLNVIPLHLPALRDRKGDIPLLARHFLEKYGRENHKKLRFSDRALETLKQYRWPGNVRELENTIERSAVLSASAAIDVLDLPQTVKGGVSGLPLEDLSIPFPEEGLEFRNLVRKFEMSLIEKAIAASEGNKNKAARLLRLNRTTLIEKMKKFRMENSDRASKCKI